MLPGLHAAQTPQVGFVLEMKGDWLVNGKSIKGPGQGLPPGAVIEHNSKIKIRSGEELRITVVLLNNQSIPRTCNSVESCEKAQFNLPKSLIPESPFSERLSAARMRLLSRDPERYVPGLARSGDFKSAKLKDRVLLQPVIVSERNAECPGLAVSSLEDEPCMRPPIRIQAIDGGGLRTKIPL